MALNRTTYVRDNRERFRRGCVDYILFFPVSGKRRTITVSVFRFCFLKCQTVIFFTLNGEKMNVNEQVLENVA